jgi:hypothetical protein
VVRGFVMLSMAVRRVPGNSETFRGLEALSIFALVRVEPPRKRSHYYPVCLVFSLAVRGIICMLVRVSIIDGSICATTSGHTATAKER